MASRDQRARLLALTRAAYSASEGVDLDWREGSAAQGPGVAGGAGGREHESAGEGNSTSDQPRRRARAPVRELRRGLRLRVSARAVVGIVACLITVGMVVVARSVMSAQALEPAPASSTQIDSSDEAVGQGDTGTGTGSGVGDAVGGNSPVSAPTGDSPGPAGSGSAEAESVSPSGSPETGSSTGSPVAATVVVHVAGNVISPGLVSLPAGSRVADALAGAGGASAEADLDALNLARVVVDGERIYVPAPGEVVSLTEVGQPAPPAGPTSSTDPVAGLINLNTADVTQLDSLPGVGPAIAARIIAWRDAHGGFTEVEELTEVSGIGPATLERLRHLVTV